MLWEAFVAVNGSSFGWLEWNVTFLSTVCAGCFVHFTGAAIGALTAPVVVSVVHEINSNYKTTSEIIDICMAPNYERIPVPHPKFETNGT